MRKSIILLQNFQPEKHLTKKQVDMRSKTNPKWSASGIEKEVNELQYILKHVFVHSGINQDVSNDKVKTPMMLCVVLSEFKRALITFSVFVNVSSN